ncbi:hypothetical protein [Flavobacterium oreochromis]|uniref:Uncharacterized protein n=2 Tax=Flavobacterium TaxID=237 RepID=A0A246GDP3_9FLAO|nr:hypothetical protein [Flavobacterium oreochromis]OWP76396.1 hypothetical protein BWG23_07955 [Flavobacterium oreochromis]OWP79420.1 hypothetical protein BWK62_02685 [Flavobacterium oreochromis]POR27923.1 hypothetical protein BWK58_03865 [Flavobacterium columnare]
MKQTNSKYYPKVNSLKKTFCVFQEVSHSSISNLTPDFISKSGSKYYYSQKGIYRLSNHWGRFANAKWRLIDNSLEPSKYKVGFATWDSFFPDNDIEKLYYIHWDQTHNEIHYQHKQTKNYDGLAILRTSKETQKRLKNARNILNLTNWAKYFDEEISLLRKKIIHDLTYTELSLDEIKKKYL